MARRIVVLGLNEGGSCPAIEVSPMDAGAMLNPGDGTWRISLSLFDGDLFDAMVILPTSEAACTPQRWRGLLSLTRAQEFRIEVPIPLAPVGGGA